MRITSVLVAVGASLMLAACGGAVEVEEVPAAEPTLVDEQVSTEEPGTVTAMAICPLKWTCWDGKYYSTLEQCTAACGGNPCERDYACNGTCVCP